MALLANDPPRLVVVAGPNGAGKSTAAAEILPSFGVDQFINADVIARGLSAFRPESVALQAGRIMRKRMEELAAARATFAIETTLASRGIATFVKEHCRGYAFNLLFFWLPSPEMAVARVAQRVRTGGHHVPEEVVRRRYERGLRNFFTLYRPLASHWRFFDNSKSATPQLVAFGDESVGTMVVDELVWDSVLRDYGHDTEVN